MFNNDDDIDDDDDEWTRWKCLKKKVRSPFLILSLSLSSSSLFDNEEEEEDEEKIFYHNLSYMRSSSLYLGLWISVFCFHYVVIAYHKGH